MFVTLMGLIQKHKCLLESDSARPLFECWLLYGNTLTGERATGRRAAWPWHVTLGRWPTQPNCSCLACPPFLLLPSSVTLLIITLYCEGASSDSLPTILLVPSRDCRLAISCPTIVGHFVVRYGAHSNYRMLHYCNPGHGHDLGHPLGPRFYETRVNNEARSVPFLFHRQSQSIRSISVHFSLWWVRAIFFYWLTFGQQPRDHSGTQL